jgi:hypothetical protein
MKRAINITYFLVVLIALFFRLEIANAQTFIPEKQVTYYNQCWTSINSTMRFSNHWGLMADFHIRTDDFYSEEYFYFVRLGAVSWINGKYPVALGVAHLWLAPKGDNTTWSDENRIYQQWSASHNEGIVKVLQRIRTEERWKDVIVADEKTSDKQFSFRLRYLAAFEIQIFKNKKIPALLISDEVLVQFGKEVGLNTFDQNRLFVGLKVPIKSDLSFDIGYMNILQQKSSGYQYDLSNVFRLFFYYTPDFRKKDKELQHYHDGGE